ncbi:MAG: hypothetical protein WDW36_002678 [Sanguina aurantia]
MDQGWQPQEAGLHQLCSLLSEGQKPGTNQAQIFQQLEQCKVVPDFNNYLSYIFAKGDSLPPEVRQSAGLQLKNNLKLTYGATSEDLRKSIKTVLLPMLVHSERVLRHTNGTIISVMVGHSGLWPDLLSALAQCMDSEDVNAVDGALDTLFKVIEEFPAELDTTVPAGAPVSASCIIVPLLLKLLPCVRPDVRHISVACLNMLARDMPRGLQDALDSYLQGLFALANDDNARVRKEVCIGLVQLLNIQPDVLQPFLYQVIEYMLASNEHADEEVALQSADFWQAFCEAQLDPDLLRPFLPKLIPLLMKNMVFEEHDEEVEEAEAAESSVREDKDQDIKPFHQKQKEHNGDAGGMDSASGEEGPRDDDNDSDTPMARWNLRRASAAGLDRLSLTYHDELLPVLLPIVQQRLQNSDWHARESAILALGAVSEGCHTGLLPFLDGMVAMLLPAVADPRPLVRIITCWSLSRYSHWLLKGVADRGQQGVALLDAVVKALLQCMLDRNRKVQESACSAIATVAEVAGSESTMKALQPLLLPIVQHLSAAITLYSRRSLYILYDAFKILADASGNLLANPTLAVLFMPPLFAKLDALDPNDKDLLPLQDCLNPLCVILGRMLEPYAPLLFNKCIASLTRQLLLKQQHQQHAALGAALPHALPNGNPPPSHTQPHPPPPAPPEYNREFIVSSLDMISALAEGLGSSVEVLVSGSVLVEALVACCSDEEADVRQSAFALVGDLARVSSTHLRAATPQLILAALANLELASVVQSNMKACNNACWALGELAIKLPPELLQPYAESVAQRAYGVLSYPGRMPSSLKENCAITLGRVAWVCPEKLALHLGHFVGPWCLALKHVRDDVEKEHAFLGLCSLIRHNPAGVSPAIGQVVIAAASWREFKCEGLRNELSSILCGLRDKMVEAGAWQAILASMEPPACARLMALTT